MVIRVTAQPEGDGVTVGFADPVAKPSEFVWITLARDEARELVDEVARVLSATEPPDDPGA